MENYTYGGAASYPDSGDSSPRSREIDFENPPPWEDQSSQPSPNYKVKFMCSYGGAITPRPHDNQLSYVGGETKILSVERNIKFAPLIAKLSALCDTDVCFKYQLPGEDLDALISVTNDDDLEHMMHEYDRLFRGMAKPARLRLFLFAVNGSRNELDQRPPSAEPIRHQTDREIRFVEALNSGPGSVDGSSPPPNILRGNSNNVDFLFAPEKVPAPLPTAPAVHPVIAPVAVLPVLPGQPEIRRDDNRVIGSDQGEIQRRIHELQRMQIGHEQQIYQQQQTQQPQHHQKADVINNNGDFYKLPDQKLPPQNLQQGYWQETKPQIPAVGGYAAPITTAPPPPIDHQPPLQQQQQQPVYMIPAQGNIGNMYRAPNPTPPAQAYYAQNQNQQPQMYRDQPPPQPQQQMYNVVTQAPPPKMVQTYPQNMSSGMGEAGGGGGGYAQVAYDSNGRQVYYATPSGVMPQQTAPYHHQPQHGIQVSGVDTRSAGGLGPEGKVVITKVP